MLYGHSSPAKSLISSRDVLWCLGCEMNSHMAAFHRTTASYCRVALRGKKMAIFNDPSNINSHISQICSSNAGY